MCTLNITKLLDIIWEIPATISTKFHIFLAGYLNFQSIQYFLPLLFFFFHKWKIIFFSWIPQPKVTFIWLNEELFDCTNKRLEMLMQIKDFLEMTLIFFMTIFIMSQLNDDWSSPNISVNFKESLGYKKNHPYVQLYLWYRINYTNYWPMCMFLKLKRITAIT